MINIPSVKLDEALQNFIRLSLQPAKRNMVLIMPSMHLQKLAYMRLQEFLGMLPGWLCEPMVRQHQCLIQYANGNCIRVLNTTMQCRGIAVDYCAMYQHQDFAWTQDDMYNILPSIKGPLDQRFYYVTE